MCSDWFNCYRDGWQGLIVPDAFQHPAKFSRSLIARIYDHMREEGWLPPGSTVLDPFGGVALGALDAMRLGCSWVGVELEEKFVKLGMENIVYWHRRFGTLPNWGEGVLLQGDSRKLLAWGFAGRKAECVVGSPPFTGITPTQGDSNYDWKFHGDQSKYSDNPANLGNLPDKGFDAAIGSPPFSTADTRDRTPYQCGRVAEMMKRAYTQNKQGDSPGQLAAMPEGSVDAAISSPPYAGISPEKNSSGIDLAKQWQTYRNQGGGLSYEAFCEQQKRHSMDYGSAEGQLAKMPEGAFEGVVSSPPYEGCPVVTIASGTQGWSANPADPKQWATGDYGKSIGQLGYTSGDTFWLAARQILEQVYLCVKPGGHAVWVVKAFVRKGKLVDFPDQWRQLCEAVGFRTLHCHRAWLVEDNGTHLTTEGGETRLTKERKSFFRRLAERKGAPRIDWETVWCMERQL